MKKKLGKISGRPENFGADPELFFKDSTGKIIGSERVIPKSKYTRDDRGKIIRDGVQLELNPNKTFCRAIFGNNIKSHFTLLKEILSEKKNQGITLCWDTVVKIDREELESLSDDSRRFGCMPSYNIYLPKENNISKILDNPATYLYRSAGGHIHIEMSEENRNSLSYESLVERMIKSLDIIVGNTSVLLDRNKLTKERRRNYGRAGEYRLPKYGIEYRTLSNYWLRDYQLMSMVYGLVNMAYRIALNKEHYDELITLVSEKDVIKAINNNNLELAKDNWNNIKEFVAEIMDGTIIYHDCAFNSSTLKYFEYFLSKGIDYWFNEEKESFIDKWANHGSFYPGFEGWLNDIVKKAYIAEKKVTE